MEHYVVLKVDRRGASFCIGVIIHSNCDVRPFCNMNSTFYVFPLLSVWLVFFYLFRVYFVVIILRWIIIRRYCFYFLSYYVAHCDLLAGPKCPTLHTAPARFRKILSLVHWLIGSFMIWQLFLQLNLLKMSSKVTALIVTHVSSFLSS